MTWIFHEVSLTLMSSEMGCMVTNVTVHTCRKKHHAVNASLSPSVNGTLWSFLLPMFHFFNQKFFPLAPQMSIVINYLHFDHEYIKHVPTVTLRFKQMFAEIHVNQAFINLQKRRCFSFQEALIVSIMIQRTRPFKVLRSSYI